MPSLYFAYGSNLCLPRLGHRLPGVRARGVADEKPLLDRVEELGTPVRARRERAFLANLSGGGVRP